MNTRRARTLSFRVLKFLPKCRSGLLLLALTASISSQGAASNSIARVWMERALSAIRVDTPHPPAQARNYFSFSVCMYDAWAAYDPVAVGYVYRNKHTTPDIAAARSNAISYAVYRMMKERHAFSRTAATTLAADDNLMIALGFDPNNQSRDTSTPIGVGNSIYDAVTLWFSNDGSRGTNGTPYPQANPPVAYPDYPSGHPRRYAYTNPALATDRSGIDNGFGQTIVDVNHWQRLNVVNAVDQNGFPTSPEQNYLGAQWLWVRPFSLIRTDETKAWIDPGPPPYWSNALSHVQFVNDIVACITADSHLTPDDGVLMDISPATHGNNSLDSAGNYGHGEFEIYDGHGYTNNPVTGQPYLPNIVKRGDYARVLAEFWADGPSSETPPGHWNVLANYLADHPLLVKKIGGTGPLLDDLQWDVKMYFAINAALHDAACAAWSIKRSYDGWRPMSAIRYLSILGQSSNPALPHYNAYGLPLISNLIEVVTSASVASGRHAGLTPGKIALLSWPGQPSDSLNHYSGVKFIHGESWSTYQRTNFVTPPFPGYISGHSTFSRSAAEVLTGLTGSPYFPGGMGVYSNYNLSFEKGPSAPLTLQWASYYDAADEAGISRIWGGIHPPVDNIAGRRVGAQVGKDVWNLVRRYWDGSVTNTPVTITRLNSNEYEIKYEALRGFYYNLQSCPEVSQAFLSDPPATQQPFDAITVRRTNTFGEPQKFYRAVSSLSP
jgi:Domain of unknown function (DUF6851)